jgi:CubicO group peptidase (beta-lactamase class C family)
MTFDPAALRDGVREACLAGDFSGALRIDRRGETLLEEGWGLADRAFNVPNSEKTRFATASFTKGFTALTVVSLIVDSVLELSTTARSLLRTDLPLVGDDVTIHDLLSHRSGIGDYMDEDVAHPGGIPPMPVSAHDLDRTEAYLRVLEGFSPKFPRGTSFSYCNSGYVILALLAERASGMPFPQLVHERVCMPAGLSDTSFLRSDELAADVARGYLAKEGLRTNVFHLPVIGSGDGGLYSTLADIHRLWNAFFAGRIVPERWVERMIQPSGTFTPGSPRYGLGFWLHPTGRAIRLEGYDAGVSLRTVADPAAEVTWTVVSNTADGAWPVARRIEELLRELRAGSEN